MDTKLIVLVVMALLLGGLLVISAQRVGPQTNLIIGQGLSNQIAVVNAGSGKITNIPGGTNVHGVGIAGGYIYVASFGAHEVNVIDSASGQRIGSVDVGGNAHHIAVSPDERYVLIAVGDANSVAILDTASVPHAFHESRSPLIAQIPVGKGPSFAVFTPDSRKAYVTNMNDNTISVLDMATMTISTTISVGQMPDHTAITQDGRFVYVTQGQSNDVAVIDTATDQVIATIPVGKGPHGIASVDSQRQQLIYVGNRGETTLSVINVSTNKVINTVEIGTKAEHITASPDGRYLYIGSLALKSILILDTKTHKVIKTLKIGTEVHQIIVIRP
jgi:YVTN family beta-propeller protein